MHNQRIMIADQDASLTSYVQRYLKTRSLTVFTAENAFDAVVKFGTFKPSIVLIEDTLPGDAGLAIRRMQARAGGQSPVFIMLAGRVTRKLVEQALRNGAHDIIAKPLFGRDIAERVAKHMGRPGDAFIAQAI